MTDQEKAELRAAIRWARADAARIRGAATSMSPSRDVADRLGALADAAESSLAGPTLPEEPSEEAIQAMLGAGHQWSAASIMNVRHAYRALYAHLTKPKTKEVEVWRVEYVARDGKPQVNVVGPPFDPLDLPTLARDEADRLRVLGCSCIHVTGPHKQTVPA